MPLKDIIVERKKDVHINEERIAATFFTEENDRIKAKQFRVLNIKKDVKSLGEHWREYKELYGIIGKVIFTFEDIVSKERKIIKLETGDRVMVPERIAFKISAKKGSVLCMISENSNREALTHKYNIKD